MSSIFSNMSRTKKRVLSSGVGLAALAGVFATMATPAAQAIPVAQRSCAFDVAGNTAVNGWRPVNSVVTINNGATSRPVVVTLNADAGVDMLAEIRVGYSVDGGAVQTPGAQNFANHTEYWQTRHSMVVMLIPSGVHSIRPYWRISGAAGKNGRHRRSLPYGGGVHVLSRTRHRAEVATCCWYPGRLPQSRTA